MLGTLIFVELFSKEEATMIAKPLLTASLFALAAAAFAQEPFPSRPITMIMPWPPGGFVDLTGRPIAAAMEKILKQPVVVTTRSGAGGVALDVAEDDGHLRVARPRFVLFRLLRRQRLLRQRLRRRRHRLSRLQPRRGRGRERSLLGCPRECPLPRLSRGLRFAREL